jgi:predicted ArsR family transcriptional regulator
VKSSQLKTSRQQVLAYIRSHRAVTSVDLSRALGMTAANARHHLAILCEQGIVGVMGEKHHSERGRPAKVYGLTQAIHGHNLDRLVSALLGEMVSEQSASQSSELRLNPEVINRLAKRLIESFATENNPAHSITGLSLDDAPELVAGGGNRKDQAPGEKGLSLATRLFMAVQRLNMMHYQARWEAHKAAPRVIFAHCPYQDVIETFPELCLIDAALLAQLTGIPAYQVEKLLPDLSGVKICVFDLIRK